MVEGTNGTRSVFRKLIKLMTPVETDDKKRKNTRITSLRNERGHARFLQMFEDFKKILGAILCQYP